MKKRGLALVLTSSILVSMIPMTASASDFTDMPNNWSTEAIEKAVENGLLKGANGKIRAEDSLTRAEMATIVNRSFKSFKISSLEEFKDVTKDDWYYDEMGKAVHMRTFKGSGEKLNPKENITREEAFVVLARAFKISDSKEDALNKFSDRDGMSDWAKEEVAGLVSEGYVAGSNGKINPKENITRAEFAKIMDNLIKVYISEESQYTKDHDGNVMINNGDVVLNDMTIEGDLIIGDGVGDGEVSLIDVTVEGRVLVRGGGENSIKIMGESKLGDILVARIDGKVRVYTEKEVEIGELIIDGYDDVILEGKFDKVNILSENIKLLVKGANINKIVSSGPKTTIDVDENSTLDRAIIDGNDTVIQGKGNIKKVDANANNIIVNTEDTKLDEGEKESDSKDENTDGGSDSGEGSSNSSEGSSSSDEIYGEDYFDGVWNEFEKTINKQAQNTDPKNILNVDFNSKSKTVNIEILDSYHKQGAIGIVFGTGLKSALTDLLKSKEVTKISSSGHIVDTLDKNGVKKPASELKDDAMDLAMGWLGDNNIGTPIEDYLIGINLDFILYGNEKNGDEFRVKYNFKFK